MRRPNRDQRRPSVSREGEFREQFRVFEIDVVGAAVHAHAYFAIHDAARGRSSVERLLNTRPLFWASTVNGHQIASLAKLGKIFDQNSTHNADQLLKAMREAPEVFSKAGLASRKRTIPESHLWIDAYMASKPEPDGAMFREWGRWLKGLRASYHNGFRDLRHAFNHTTAATPEEWSTITGKTDQRRLKVLIGSLLHLRAEITQLYDNGRLPIRPRHIRYSSRLKPYVDSHSPYQDVIVKEVRAILNDLLRTQRAVTAKSLRVQ